jgi:hypothetical protein
MCESGSTGEAAIDASDRQSFRDRNDVRNEVVVTQHHAFRLAGRSGRVDDSSQIIARDLRQHIVERCRFALEDRFALLLDRIKSHRTSIILRDRLTVEKDQPLKALNASDRFFGMLVDFLSRNAKHFRVRVLKYEPDLFDGLRCVDRNVDRAEREDREVHE